LMAIQNGYIQTVCGPLDPAALGQTLMHEHVLCDIAPPDLRKINTPEAEITLENCWQIRHHWAQHRGNCRLDDENTAAEELSGLHAVGGRAVVELTISGIAPDPEGLRRISMVSGVDIIAGCGFYVEAFRDDEFLLSSTDELTTRMVADIRNGIGESGIRAGIIGEIGCSDAWTETERRTLQAAVITQCETGASLNVHPPRCVAAVLEIVQMVNEFGGDRTRLILSHIDRTVFNLDDLFRIADTGCVIEYDFFGIESSYYPFQDIDLPNDAMRLDAIRALIDRGHGSQITLSQDICTKTRLTRYGGHGYGHLISNVIPVMQRKGFSDEEISTLMIDTPRRLLTISND